MAQKEAREMVPMAAERAVVSCWASPPRIVYGPGAAALVGEESRRLGLRALVVTDRHLADETSIVREACSHLAAHGVSTRLFAEAHPHPVLSIARRGAEVLKQEGCRVVVGLGGGSSMDTAKLIAAAARNPELVDPEVWAGRFGAVLPVLSNPRPAVPLVQVPTIAATSSEANSVASMVLDGTRKKKLVLHPLLLARLAIVDPALTCSVPNRQTAEGSLETMCRVLVPYLTDGGGSKAIQDRIGEGIVQVVLENTSKALQYNNDIEARTNLSAAVINSVMGWTQVGRYRYGHVLWYISNALGTVAQISKGAGMAALLVTYLRWVLEHSVRLPNLGGPLRLAEMGRNALGVTDRENTRAAEQTLRLIEEHVSAWGLPTSLGEAGVSGELIPELMSETLDQWGGEGGAIGWLPAEDLATFYSEAL